MRFKSSIWRLQPAQSPRRPPLGIGRSGWSRTIARAIAGRQSFGLPEHELDRVASIRVAAFVVPLGYSTGFSRCFRPEMQGDAGTSPFVFRPVSEPVAVRCAFGLCGPYTAGASRHLEPLRQIEDSPARHQSNVATRLAVGLGKERLKTCHL